MTPFENVKMSPDIGPLNDRKIKDDKSAGDKDWAKKSLQSVF